MEQTNKKHYITQLSLELTDATPKWVPIWILPVIQKVWYISLWLSYKEET
jgi:hypothetical protein